MPQIQNQNSAPPGPSAMGTLVHYLIGGACGAVLGAVFAALVFYLTVLGFLYAQQPVQGADPETVNLPQLPDYPLEPPIARADFQPPEGKQDAALDTDYLKACWHQLMAPLDIKQVGMAFAAWAVAAAAFGLAVGLVGAVLQLLFGQYWSPLLGILALLAALAGIGLFVAQDQFAVQLPLDINIEARLIIYASVAALNLLWMSIAGFRFRALLFILATVVVGEAMKLGLPPAAWTTTALWHACLFFFIPAGYGWRAVERAQQKGILA